MLDSADKGSYFLDKIEIKNLDETKAAKYRNEFLGFVFQSFNLINYKESQLKMLHCHLYYRGISKKRQTRALNFLQRLVFVKLVYTFTK